MGNFILTLLKGLGILAAIAIVIAVGWWLLALAFMAFGAILSVVLACLPFLGIALAVGIVIALIWAVGRAVSKRDGDSSGK